MALKHILKLTTQEAILKCYITDSSGGTIDISLSSLTAPTEVYIPGTNDSPETDGHYATYTGSRVYITQLWWGLKKDKQLDITRIIDPVTPVVHSHYYLINAGSYEYKDFYDRVYANKDLRLTFDGPGHCIIRLRKEGWDSKLETAEFGVYDNVNVVGS